MKYILVVFVVITLVSSSCALVAPRQTANDEIEIESELSMSTSIEYFVQAVDHFRADTRTFKQKFLIDSEYWDGHGPVFFYCGNEGPIESFSSNSGFIYETAESMKALVVFMEHRYYGESMPVPGTPGHDMDMSYLSTEQALADFATFIVEMKRSSWENAAGVIAWGGSYGGMLSAWLRMKYPHVVSGAIAASAPVHMFPGMTSAAAYNAKVTDDYRKVKDIGDHCVEKIRLALGSLVDHSKTIDGRKKLSKQFNLCTALEPSEVSVMIGFIQDAIMSMAELDYPYATEFLNPLPPNPVTVACNAVVDMNLKSNLDGLKAAIDIYYNYTGKTECYNVSGSESPSLGWASWGYQACTEMVLPIGSDNKTDFFVPDPFSLKKLREGCQKSYGKEVVPRASWGYIQWGGLDAIMASSNIVFSNGDLDPWSVGGITHEVLPSPPPSIVLIEIKGGAHHLDLRASNPHDPQSVIDAREKERSCIREFLNMSM